MIIILGITKTKVSLFFNDFILFGKNKTANIDSVYTHSSEMAD